VHQPAGPADDTSSSLLVRVRRQDPDAWLRLIEWVSPFVLRWCRQAGLQAADCDDVSQLVLQRVWSHFGTFRKDRATDSFRGWVYTITRNQCRSFLASRRTDVNTVADVPLPVAPDPADALDLQKRALWLLLQEIVARHGRDVGFKAFYRAAVDGVPAKEVGEELGLKAWTVRQHRCRWVKRLRDRLAVDFGGLIE
jgi:RNA polymerase sigma-70 factor (ECF subfamily)